MTKRRIRSLTRRLLPLAALALALALPSSAPAPPGGGGGGGGGNGGGGGGGGGSSPCDGLTNDSDRDHDGLGDLEDCSGLRFSRNAVAFDYPGCLVDATAAETGDCTDPDLPDIFFVFFRDTDHPAGSAFDLDFAGEGPISDSDLFAPAELSATSGGVGVRFHAVPAGESLLSTPPRGVTLQQSAIIITENRDLAYSRDSAGALICPDDPPSNGVTTLGNPNESGNPIVNSQRILDRIDCIYGNLAVAGNFAEKRKHLINTAMHETFHSLEQAPDPTAYHQETGSDCVMATAPVVDRKGKLIVPLTFCGPTQETMQAGATSQTAPSSGTVCGDNTVYDGDGTFACATPPSPPGT
jgi:hypothetical protein